MKLPATAADGRELYLDADGRVGNWHGAAVSPENAGPIVLAPKALAIVQAVDRARGRGYQFTDLLTLGQLLGRIRTPRKSAAARAAASIAREHRAARRIPKVRPPIEPPMPVEERDAAIRRRRAAGESLRDLAHAYQLSSPERVRIICKRMDGV